MNHKIIVVEDEKDIQILIKETMEQQGYKVLTADDGEQASILMDDLAAIDLIILDLMLPKIDGLTVLKKIRSLSSIPVLILSAKDGEYEKILGLEFGADDYLTKPFSLLELQARVKALLRRNNEYQTQGKTEETEKIITVGELTIEPDNFLVKKNNLIVNLTSKEFQILNLFVSNPKKVYTKVQLYQEIWNDEFIHDENVMNVHIRRLRKKIEDAPSNPIYIKTVWGIGYKLGVEPQECSK
ncbi:hypothetical protein UAY_02094 [Enterococcus moraviensis ATCC BAA-383]|uniref:DNA-binding response regulator n=1 Tax=Enterococcus moraviensis ATCC BAA-383 TaxID=1158609 RepID=R2SUB0_9ENTE|nr:response regulator transcription factor [Enterococcus moraviensis]EOH98825.1 hypothetical protein UAY_02094 [Enterococcus moraviensis ATCC BAA-383]EOT72000.1 hypothetical protein I586_01807 [Enterococcus moraviensis ATCC BAA-383]OJG68119.1 hypothetical protein RV09_GL002230 [Enterococcus moraviensis]